jgi:hypothetical protein
MSGTSSAAIAAALVTTGALRQRRGCAWAGLRRAVPNTLGLWPTWEAVRAVCMVLWVMLDCCRAQALTFGQDHSG